MHTLILLVLVIFSFPTLAQQSVAQQPVAEPPTAEQGSDENSRLCAPFRDGIVDPAIVQSMLQASEEGRLYRIQPKSSMVGFCVDSSIGRVEARFKGIQGGLALRREVWGDRSQMLVMVDTNTLAMDRDCLKNTLKGENFLDTYTYPKILFVSKKLWWRNQNEAVLEGMLTMHGVTKPVYFNITMETVPNLNTQSVADLVISATAFIKRSDFDMDNLTWLVSDTVELCMRIEAALFKK